jgi:hypothetical protein
VAVDLMLVRAACQWVISLIEPMAGM